MDDWEKIELLKERIRQIQTDDIWRVCLLCRTKNRLKNTIKTLKYGYLCDRCLTDPERLNWEVAWIIN